MGKRIIIMGAGAVGGYVGGYFARDGADVTLFDPWPEHVERMREDGLKLSGLTDAECFTTPVKAMHLTEIQGLSKQKPIDIAFVCMKSYDTEWATMLVRDYLAPTGFVVSLQNCINEERIANLVGWGKTVGCIAAKIAVELTGPARIHRGVELGGNKHTVFRIGEVHGRVTPRVTEIADMLGGIDSAMVTTNLWGERWSKLVTNAMRNGICASTGMSGNECDRDEMIRRLTIRLAGEGVKIGQALGYDLEKINKFEPEKWAAAADGDAKVHKELEDAMVEATKSRAEGSRPSMGQDMIKGRRTEIDFINGFIVEKGAEVGMEAPANAGLVAAVKRVERGEGEAGRDNVADI